MVSALRVSSTAAAEASLFVHTVTIFLCLSAGTVDYSGRLLLNFPLVGLFQRPIWVFLFARARRWDRSVSRTTTSYRSANQPSSAKPLLLDLQRRLSFESRTAEAERALALCTSYLCMCMSPSRSQ
jgi:hypothetical protein